MMWAVVMAEARRRGGSNPRRDLLVYLEWRQGEVVMVCWTRLEARCVEVEVETARLEGEMWVKVGRKVKPERRRGR